MNKVWGVKKSLYASKTTEIDLLTLKKDTFCSIHYHNFKYNQFNVIEGCVAIETYVSSYTIQRITLRAGESHTIYAPAIHRFVALEDSKVVEIAYANNSKAITNDIVRLFQGGKIVKDQEVCERDLKKCRK